MDMQGYLEQQLSSLTVNPTPGSANTDPKILFVNGHFSYVCPGPTYGGEPYWNYNGNHTDFFNAANTFFNLTAPDWLFIDGSTVIAIDSSGGERKVKGYNYAQSHYSYLTFNATAPLDYYIVSHSEGCAYAAGIAQYLKAQGHTIHEMLFLSADEGDEFTTDPAIPTYQILLSYWSTSWLTGKKKIEKDWVVGAHRVQGVTKYGIVQGNYGWGTVHGSTNNPQVFNKVADLKSVVVTQNWNGSGQIFYSQSNTSHGTKFYSVEDHFIAPNHPNWNTTTLTIDE